MAGELSLPHCDELVDVCPGGFAGHRHRADHREFPGLQGRAVKPGKESEDRVKSPYRIIDT